jgi:hypothetical protein
MRLLCCLTRAVLIRLGPGVDPRRDYLLAYAITGGVKKFQIVLGSDLYLVKSRLNTRAAIGNHPLTPERSLNSLKYGSNVTKSVPV